LREREKNHDIKKGNSPTKKKINYGGGGTRFYFFGERTKGEDSRLYLLYVENKGERRSRKEKVISITLSRKREKKKRDRKPSRPLPPREKGESVHEKEGRRRKLGPIFTESEGGMGRLSPREEKEGKGKGSPYTVTNSPAPIPRPEKGGKGLVRETPKEKKEDRRLRSSKKRKKMMRKKRKGR